MNARSQRILERIAWVDAERRRRQADPSLQRRVEALKRYQHRRFQLTYADMLADRRYQRAAEFFLEDLYGPYDFSTRDTQFARVVPGLARLFSGELMTTIEELAELHGTTEELDSLMSAALPGPNCDAPAYAAAWQQVGRPDARSRQIELVRRLGDALSAYTRKPLLRQSLRLMRRPAATMGLGAVQGFLESGFEIFSELREPRHFLDEIEAREAEFKQWMFEVDLGFGPSDHRDRLPEGS